MKDSKFLNEDRVVSISIFIGLLGFVGFVYLMYLAFGISIYSWNDWQGDTVIGPDECMSDEKVVYHFGNDVKVTLFNENTGALVSCAPIQITKDRKDCNTYRCEDIIYKGMTSNRGAVYIPSTMAKKIKRFWKNKHTTTDHLFRYVGPWYHIRANKESVFRDDLVDIEIIGDNLFVYLFQKYK